LNQIICDNKVSEMKALENLNVDEYYQTLSTYVRIVEEKNEALEGNNNKGNENQARQKLGS
jgi:hypothetical protein